MDIDATTITERFRDMGRYEKTELLFYLLWPAVTVFIASRISLTYLTLIVLSFGPPSVVLFHRLKERTHFLYFVTVFALALSPLLDYLAHASGLWFIETTLPRIWQYVPVESYLWGFLVTFYMIGLYERYFRYDRHPGFHRWFYAFHLLAAVSLVIIPFSGILPGELYLPYFYVIGMVVIFLLPLAEYLHLQNSHRTGLILTSLYFAYVNASHEVSALLNGIWEFPLAETTAVLGHFRFLGHTIPYEEVTLYFFFLAPSLIAYYELCSTHSGGERD